MSEPFIFGDSNSVSDMSQPNQISDLETLEEYLDGELDAATVAQVDARLAAEPALRASIERIRGQRARRLAAMSMAFDADAASVERLVASVRDARAAELVNSRASRWRIGPLPSYFAAAACLACGLLLGGSLQQQHNRINGGQVETPTVGIGGAGLIENASMNLDSSSHGSYFVPLLGADGHARVKFHFDSAQQAQAFVELMNRKAAAEGQSIPNLGDARISNESY